MCAKRSCRISQDDLRALSDQRSSASPYNHCLHLVEFRQQTSYHIYPLSSSLEKFTQGPKATLMIERPKFPLPTLLPVTTHTLTSLSVFLERSRSSTRSCAATYCKSTLPTWGAWCSRPERGFRCSVSITQGVRDIFTQYTGLQCGSGPSLVLRDELKVEERGAVEHKHMSLLPKLPLTWK
jgi:hypothetical protein